MTGQILKIVNEKGLHARASAKFVEVVEAHDAMAEVTKALTFWSSIDRSVSRFDW
jgi:phosphotransferase system HPr-like phosphotransfer protein